MDEFSFYGTIGAIILIQISFFWLFRYDHYTRKLSSAYLQSKRLVVLVGSSDHLTDGGGGNLFDAAHCEAANENYSSELVLIERLRKQLESSGNNFKVLTILLAPQHKRRSEKKQLGQEQQIIMKDGIIHLESDEINYYHLGQVVNCIESELAHLKLHACVDIQQVLPTPPPLPPSSPPAKRTRRPFDVMEHLRNYSIPATGLLLALQAQIARDSSRIVFVRDLRHRFASADQQHGDDIYWQFFEQFDQTAIDFVNKSEHYQNSPVPIQVDIEQRQQQQPPDSGLQSVLRHWTSRATIMNSIKALSLLGDFVPRPSVKLCANDVGGNHNAPNEDETNGRQHSDRLAQIDVIAAKITEILLLENPRSMTVTI